MRTFLRLTISLALSITTIEFSETLSFAGPVSASAQTVDPDPNFVQYDDSVPGVYIVSLAAGAYTPPLEPTEPTEPTEPITDLNSSMSSESDAPFSASDPDTVSDDITYDYFANPPTVHEFFGTFSCTMSEVQARAMSHDPRVATVESNPYVYGCGRWQGHVSWGLGRTVSRTAGVFPAYTCTRTGQNVDAYVVDTGIWKDSVDFNNYSGRVTWEYSPGFPNADDDLNHGTAIASIIGGKDGGVAPRVRLHALKVLDKNAKGDLGSVLQALNLLYNSRFYSSTTTSPRAVMNLSFGWILGGNGYNPSDSKVLSFKTALLKFISKRVVVVVAAGNEHADAKNFFPACLPEVITVGAIDTYNYLGSFNGKGTNYGSVVDLFAPGKDVAGWAFVTATYPNRVNVLGTDWRGTSFAAPYVSGVVAQYLEANPSKTPAEVQTWITSNSTTGQVRNFAGSTTLPTGTVNRILFTNL